MIDTSKQDKNRKRNERRRERELNDIKKLLSCVEGRRFIWRIFTEAGLYRNCFTGNSTSFFYQGKQSIAQWLLDEVMSADRNAFAQIQLEFYSEQKSLEIQQQKEEKDNE